MPSMQGMESPTRVGLHLALHRLRPVPSALRGGPELAALAVHSRQEVGKEVRLLRRAAMWLVWNVPLGPLAPHVFGFAIGSKPRRLDDSQRGHRQGPE